MSTRLLLSLACLLLLFTCLGCGRSDKAANAPRDEWIDKDTGHKVIRLSRREGSHEMFYFHQNPFTADGDKMVFIGPAEKGRAAFAVDLKTLDIRKMTFEHAVDLEVVAPKRRELFYLDGDTVYATNIDTPATRAIAKVPEYYIHGRGLSINSDETLLAGCYAKGEEQFYSMPRDEWIKKIFEAKLPNAIYTINIGTGEVREFYKENEWLGHVQFSPTDPALIEFCHEGPERLLHRMWLIRTDGTGLTKLYPTEIPKTLVTHEFWDPNGKDVWFDLQAPRLRGKMGLVTYVFGPHTYLARTNIDTGDSTLYPLKRSQVCWHYNVSRDGKLLCGDGDGRFFELARSARWINLYVPEGGKLKVERLCSMKRNSYTIAPNAHFTPDGKWVVFLSDMDGSPQIYAVEVQASR
jgi:oligogalacturonide lyase